MSLAREISKLFGESFQGKAYTSLFDNTFECNSVELIGLKYKLDDVCRNNPNELLKIIFQAIAIEKITTNIGIESAAFVATIPHVKLSGVKGTFYTIDQLLRNSKREVIAFGYEITDSEVISLFQRCSKRDVDLLLVCDRERGSGRQILDKWPSHFKCPVIFEDIKNEESAIYAKMHSKLMLVDKSKLLITSANFTYHGMNGNIEFGVLLEGSLISSLRDILCQYLSSNAFKKIS